ncbi:MAG: hypothetical protein FWF84_05990 [Kiritimatiellaeota bacterium]|nr:hypothetical protein [Kiritimatiellota bacterium]
MNWKLEMSGVLGKPAVRLTRAQQDELRFQKFLGEVVMPVFAHVKAELAQYGREVVIRETSASAQLTIRNASVEELSFCVLCRHLPTAQMPYAEVRSKERRGLRVLKSEAKFKDGMYSLDEVTSEAVLDAFQRAYRAIFAS